MTRSGIFRMTFVALVLFLSYVAAAEEPALSAEAWLKSFYEEYMTNVMEGRDNSELCRSCMSEDLPDNLCRVASSVGADAVIHAQEWDGDRYGDDVRLIRSDERVKIVRHDGHDNETWYMLKLGKSVPAPLSIDEENGKLLKHATQNYVLDNAASLDAVREIFSDKVSLAYIHFIISQSGRFEYVSVFLMGDGQNVTFEYADENYLDLFSWLVENIKPVPWDGPLPYCRGALRIKAYGQNNVVRRDIVENMAVTYYDKKVTVTRLNGGLEQSDFKETFQYDVDRNKNAMVELVDYRLDLEPSKKAIMSAVRGVIEEAKLQGIYRLRCPVVYSRSLNLEYLEIRGQPLWTSEDYCKVYSILNDVRITGFKL